jgi:hypothetical protein
MTEHDRIFLGAAIFLAQSERIRGGLGKHPLAASSTSKASRKEISKAIEWAASLENAVETRHAIPNMHIVYAPPLPGEATPEGRLAPE